MKKQKSPVSRFTPSSKNNGRSARFSFHFNEISWHPGYYISTGSRKTLILQWLIFCALHWFLLQPPKEHNFLITYILGLKQDSTAALAACNYIWTQQSAITEISLRLPSLPSVRQYWKCGKQPHLKFYLVLKLSSYYSRLKSYQTVKYFHVYLSRESGQHIFRFRFPLSKNNGKLLKNKCFQSMTDRSIEP